MGRLELVSKYSPLVLVLQLTCILTWKPVAKLCLENITTLAPLQIYRPRVRLLVPNNIAPVFVSNP